eukprot:gene18843-12641_t
MSRSVSKKLVIVGDSVNGKTSLLETVASGTFPVFRMGLFEIQILTAGWTKDGAELELALWDTAGQDDYDHIRPLSYPDTDVLLVTFDISNTDSLESVEEKWAPEVNHFCPHAPIVLVGTKVDLRGEDARDCVTNAQGKAVATAIGAVDYVECSALHNRGVKEVFECASRNIIGVAVAQWPREWPHLILAPPYNECEVYLRQGPALNVAKFASWFGAANPQPSGDKTLAGDTLHLRGWEDAWASPGANLADALVHENPTTLQGVYGDELEPVALNTTTMELPPVVLFRPLTAVGVEIVGLGGGGAPAITLSVRLAVEEGTVGYARRKIEVLAGVGDGGNTHAGRLWLVGGDGGTGKRKLRRSGDGELLQAAGVTATAAGGTRGVSLLYERHRTWKGAFAFAPKYEPLGGGAAVCRGSVGTPATLAVSAPTKQRFEEWFPSAAGNDLPNQMIPSAVI